MKTKFVIKSKKDVFNWFDVCNLLAKSMCDYSTVLSQFNSLNPSDRITIKNRLDKCDEVRRKKVPCTEQEEWIIGIMVDANIIACEYNVDPLTVMLCVKPICKANERIIVK